MKTSLQPTNRKTPNNRREKYTARLLFPNDSEFWFETLRSFGHSAYGGSDFGEVIAIAADITESDYDSWYKAWISSADRLSEEAESALAKGHRVSARDGFLRASNYYRSAEFFLHGYTPDPRHDHAYHRSVECFRAAAALFPIPIEPVKIPYEDTFLTGYLYRVDGSNKARPTILLNNGFDGTVEEMHFYGAVAGIERGYTVLSFEGPGQGSLIHDQGLTFRPDWEKVVGPVIDFASKLPEVDQKRIALLGNSMSGVLAPRAAAFEHRIAAVIAFDGVYDLSLLPSTFMPADRQTIETRLRAEVDTEFDKQVASLISRNPIVRWAANQAMYVFGKSTPRTALATMLDYHLRNGIAEKITCPTLVCNGETDLFYEGQARLLFDHLTCPKTYIEFRAEEGAGAHCQSGAQRLAFGRVYNWLDDTLQRAC